jgi:hypothetical protein
MSSSANKHYEFMTKTMLATFRDATGHRSSAIEGDRMTRASAKALGWAFRLGCIIQLGCSTAGSAPESRDASASGIGGSVGGGGMPAANAGKSAVGTGGASAGRSGAAGVSAGKSGAGGTAGTAGAADVGGNSARWAPHPGTSWQWQLSGALDTSFDVAVYDIDLFETTEAQLTALHAQQRKVICYFDTAYEPGRPDSAALQAYRGNPIDGWPGQYWLDTRAKAVSDVMVARLELAKSKRCDGVEADDVDARSNDPGFPISANDQQTFITQLAEAAHARGLAFGLKNDLDEIPRLLASVDFAVNEQCFEYNECDALQPFIAADKPVFQVEYVEGSFDAKAAEICPKANALNFDSLIKHLDLGPERRACR